VLPSLDCRYLLLVIFCGFYGFLAPLAAGTVYLKNGRVIRGPVVERDDAGVVLGINGGKMRIYKRFITAVVYDDTDPAREKKAAPPQARTARVVSTGPESAVAGLPADPRELLDRLKREAAAPVSRVRQPPVATVTSRPGLKGAAAEKVRARKSPPSTVTGLAGQAAGPAPGSSIRPPLGWRLSRDSGLVRFVKPGQQTVPASLELLRLAGSGPSTTECLRLLREEHHSMLDACEVVDESFSRNSAGREVFELTSRGRFGGREVTVHQRIILSGSNAWLLSAFRDSRDLDTGRLLAQSIDSLRLASGGGIPGRP